MNMLLRYLLNGWEWTGNVEDFSGLHYAELTPRRTRLILAQLTPGEYAWARDYPVATP